jgi:hypothetical protein
MMISFYLYNVRTFPNEHKIEFMLYLETIDRVDYHDILFVYKLIFLNIISMLTIDVMIVWSDWITSMKLIYTNWIKYFQITSE